MKCNTFILKCFLQFVCTSLKDCLKEGGNFLDLHQKKGVPQKRGGGRGRLVPSEKMGGFQRWRKLCNLFLKKTSQEGFIENKTLFFTRYKRETAGLEV